jgi:putative membrane protein
MATLAIVWLGPLPRLAVHRFSAHMTMHMGVVAVAAPLVGLALAGGRFDPARRWPSLFSAVPASLLELVVVWAWHTPVLHRVARESTVGLLAEQSTFLACGLLLWISAFGGAPAHLGPRAGAGVFALLLTSTHMTLLGALLALSPRPLYAHAGDAIASATALSDQQLGGALMLLVGGASYLTGGLWLSTRLLVQQPLGRRGHG